MLDPEVYGGHHDRGDEGASAAHNVFGSPPRNEHRTMRSLPSSPPLIQPSSLAGSPPRDGRQFGNHAGPPDGWMGAPVTPRSYRGSSSGAHGSSPNAGQFDLLNMSLQSPGGPGQHPGFPSGDRGSRHFNVGPVGPSGYYGATNHYRGR